MAKPVTVDEEKSLWDLDLRGKNNPESLLNGLWWRNNFFGISDVNEHRQMTWGDVSIETDICKSHLKLNCATKGICVVA